ncbi:hypothetical protein AVEN_241910-1 [Araneus ventricosus]|uniref:Uncharacterized protein n=1 Tax=Araneus ventricosus TaxID=182803 RepID=A0A4Y2LL69_ARAVE|nr:hypothetical protein AVEN_241910-1 [Araneus ventricosus]
MTFSDTLSSATSNELFTSEIYSIHKVIANSAWRNPPTHDWYAGNRPGLSTVHRHKIRSDFIDQNSISLSSPTLLLTKLQLTAPSLRACFYIRPRWPGGEVPTLGPEGSRFDTRCHRMLNPLRPNVLPLVWCNTTHPNPAYPTGFKALKSWKGRELTTSSKRTQAPLAFIKSFSSYTHTTPRNMGGN